MHHTVYTAKYTYLSQTSRNVNRILNKSSILSVFLVVTLRRHVSYRKGKTRQIDKRSFYRINFPKDNLYPGGQWNLNTNIWNGIKKTFFFLHSFREGVKKSGCITMRGAVGTSRVAAVPNKFWQEPSRRLSGRGPCLFFRWFIGFTTSPNQHSGQSL